MKYQKTGMKDILFILEDFVKLLNWVLIRNGYIVELSCKHVNIIKSWSYPEASLWLPC